MFTDVARVVRASALADSELGLDALDPAQVLDGDPEVRSLVLHDGEDVGIGVWQHSVGVSADVEADEVFVVLSGRATVQVEDGPTLEVGPGDVEPPAGGCADHLDGARDPPQGLRRAPLTPRLADPTRLQASDLRRCHPAGPERGTGTDRHG